MAIIGVIATIGFVALTGSSDSADDSKILSDVRSIQTALEAYRTNDGDGTDYPIKSSNSSYCLEVSATNIPGLDIDLGFASGQGYYYQVNDPSDPTAYRVVATLGDASHSALDTDLDTNLNKKGTTTALGNNTNELNGATVAATNVVPNCECNNAQAYGTTATNAHYCVGNSTITIDG